MWLPQPALNRIRELEALLRDSVSGDVYRASLARIAALERRVDWQSDMLLRRGQSMPLPPTPEEKAEAVKHEPPPAPSDTAIAQAEAIVAEGKRMRMGREEIEKAVAAQTGLTGQDLAAVMSGRVM